VYFFIYVYVYIYVHRYILFLEVITDNEFEYILGLLTVVHISPLIVVDVCSNYLFKNSLLVEDFKSTITIIACFSRMRKITSVEIRNACSFISGILYISH